MAQEIAFTAVRIELMGRMEPETIDKVIVAARDSLNRESYKQKTNENTISG